MKRLCLIAGCLLSLLHCLAAAAPAQQSADSQTEQAIQQRNQVLDQVAAKLQESNLSSWQLANLSEQLKKLLAEAEQAKSEANDALDGPQAELEALGPAPKEEEPAESPSVAKQREEINERLADLKGRAKQAELHIARAEELLAVIGEVRKTQLQEHLLARGPAPLSLDTWQRALQQARELIRQLAATTSQRWREIPLLQQQPVAFAWLSMAIIIAMLVLWPLRRWLLRNYGRDLNAGEPSYAQRTLAAFVEGTARGILPALVLVFSTFAIAPQNFSIDSDYGLVPSIVGGLVFYIVVAALIKAALAPTAPAWRIVPVNASSARQISRRLLLLAAACSVVLSFYLVFWQFEPLDPALETIAKLIASGLIALLTMPLLRKHLWQRKRALGKNSGKTVWRRAWSTLRVSLAVLLPLVLLTALAGFVNLASFIVSHLVVSGLFIGILLLLYKLLDEVLEQLILRLRTGARASGQSVTERDHTASLKPWLKFALGVMLAVPAFVLLIIYWGVPQPTIEYWARSILAGFKVGELTFSPGNILLALVVFITLIIVVRLLRSVIRDHVLARTRLDSGLKHSLLTGFSYLGILFAVLVIVAVLGISFTNLALVFGALSIGIGLGLQNVVNNFVSGLVLLIQRPVKVGDWVVVGEYEGFIKSIEAIATEIETFDKASVIIPNSEMVSSAVVNWTHNSRVIRISVQVGVAYGSDTRKVKEILLACTKRLDEILEDPEPQVLFMAFADSALTFELRVYIHDAGNYLTVASDLRFEIEQAFREAGIEIPFPQQDIHIKGLDNHAAPAIQEQPDNRPALAASQNQPVQMGRKQ